MEGVRAFQCSECQKSFSRNSDLQKHIDAVHKGLRPYECITCQKRFSQKSSLKRHREAVHEGEPYLSIPSHLLILPLSLNIHYCDAFQVYMWRFCRTERSALSIP